MNFRPLVVFFWASLVGTAAVAGEERQTRIEIAVDDDAAGEQTFVFDSQEAGFDLHSLAVGEVRTLTDKSGNTADVRRTADGFEFDVNGKKVSVDDMPAVDEPHGAHGAHEIEMRVDDSDSTVMENRGVRKVKIIRTGDVEGVTVISGREIDAATRERISEVLRSAGQDGEVQFIDGSELHADGAAEMHGRHEVRIIKKEVDVTD